MQAGKLIVLTGPSGVGKGTLLRALLQRHPELYVSISVTTRAPRPGEVDGQHYYFVNRNQFERMVANGELLEWAEFAGNYYGTPRLAVEDKIRQGHQVILEIELALRIFILPPSLSELEFRIRNRGQDSEEAIARRLQRAQEEIDAANEFDIQIINDDFEQALAQIEAALFTPAPCYSSTAN